MRKGRIWECSGREGGGGQGVEHNTGSVAYVSETLIIAVTKTCVAERHAQQCTYLLVGGGRRVGGGEAALVQVACIALHLMRRNIDRKLSAWHWIGREGSILKCYIQVKKLMKAAARGQIWDPMVRRQRHDMRRSNFVHMLNCF